MEEGDNVKAFIEDYIKEHLVVTKHLPSPAIPVLYMKYLTVFYKDKLSRWSDSVENFHLPPFLKKAAFDLIEKDHVSIKVKGAMHVVETIKETLSEIIEENDFYQKTFSLPLHCRHVHLKLWERQLSFLNEEVKERFELVVEYKFSHSEVSAHDDATKVEFIVYGFNEVAFDDVKQMLISKLSQPLMKDEINLSTDDLKKIKSAIFKGQLDFKNYVVDVYCNEKCNKAVLHSPDDSVVDMVKAEIETFCQQQASSAERDMSLSIPVYLVFTSKKFSFFGKAIAVAKKLQAFVRCYKHDNKSGLLLKGRPCILDTLQTEVLRIVSEVEGLLGRCEIPVDPLVLPCLTKHLCKKLNSDLESNFVAVETLPDQASSATVWSWLTDDGSFSPYSSKVCFELTSSYQRNPNGICTITVRGGEFYIIDFSKMVQVNPKTNKQNLIKFSCSAEEVVQWYWRNDCQSFTAYNDHESLTIETMYQSNVMQPLLIGGKAYTFDFAKMMQINIATAHRRLIKREKTLHKTQLLVKNCIILHGLADNLDVSKREINNALCRYIKKHEINLPFPCSRAFEEVVKKIVTKNQVQYTIDDSCDKTKPKLLLKGVRSCLDKTITDIQAQIIELQSSSSDLETTPDYWEKQSSNLELFKVAKGSYEWGKIEEQFKASMPAFFVNEIIRIQNMWLYERYEQQKKQLNSKNGVITNELDLFHGTRNTNPKEIYDSEEGFDMRFCTSGMWGLANYFAVNASYSHSYAHKNLNGQLEMFLVKVLEGECYHCSPNSSLRMPPRKQAHSGQLQFHQMRYDTVSGFSHGSKIYMTYDNQKAYPSYLIKYKQL